MICQRCSSGSLENEGIPVVSEPLRSTHFSAPGLAFLTSGATSGGAFPIPLASRPWQAEQ